MINFSFKKKISFKTLNSLINLLEKSIVNTFRIEISIFFSLFDKSSLFHENLKTIYIQKISFFFEKYPNFLKNLFKNEEFNQIFSINQNKLFESNITFNNLSNFKFFFNL